MTVIDILVGVAFVSAATCLVLWMMDNEVWKG
jgi:hypothetical protein